MTPEGAADVFEFVTRLRAFKAWAGDPSLGRLQQLTGYPRSTLFDALNPRRAGLPALDLVRRLVGACGGTPDDVAAWTTAWRRIQTQDLVRDREPGTADASASQAPQPTRSAEQGVPRQLPAVVHRFVGRTADLETLDGLARATAESVRVALITGMAGVGKTTLAVHWAHRVAGRFPDGQLYADLRGFSPVGDAADPAETLRGFLTALGVEREKVPLGMGERIALYRSLLSGRRVLVVLDNAADAGQVRPLLPGGGRCLVLVTSRDRMTGLIASQGAHPIRLGPFSPAEAHDMLRGRIGPERADADPDAVGLVVERCGRLPLALAVAAARAAANPELPLGSVAAELAAPGRLDALRTGDVATEPRVVLSWSYRRLSKEAARLFRLLGGYPGFDIGVPVAAALAGVPTVRELLTELSEASLVSEAPGGRYTVHDLIRTYAADLTRTTDAEAERRAALRRLLDHYVHNAFRAARLLNPIRTEIPLPEPASPPVAEPLADAESALAWLTAEHQGLVAVVGEAAGNGFDAHAWALARILDRYLDFRGHWADWLAVEHVATVAAHRLGDPRREGMARTTLADAYMRLGRDDEAHAELTAALQLLDVAEDWCELAAAHLTLCILFDRQDRPADALHHAERGLELYRRGGDEHGQASALNNMAWSHARLENLPEALRYGQDALAVFQRLGHQAATAAAWDTVGTIRLRIGDAAAAAEAFRHSVALSGGLGDRLLEAQALSRLGDSYHAMGEPDNARAAWRQALSILVELGHESADEVRTRLQAS